MPKCQAQFIDPRECEPANFPQPNGITFVPFLAPNHYFLESLQYVSVQDSQCLRTLFYSTSAETFIHRKASPSSRQNQNNPRNYKSRCQPPFLCENLTPHSWAKYYSIQQ